MIFYAPLFGDKCSFKRNEILSMKEKFFGGLLVFLGACSFGVLSSIVKTAYKSGYTLGQVTGIQCFLGMIILWGIHFLVKTFNKSKVTIASKTPLTKK